MKRKITTSLLLPMASAVLAVGLLGSMSHALGVRITPPVTHGCGLPIGWSQPAGGQLTEASLFEQLSAQSVVLLGERHDRLDHHRWQLEVLRKLQARGVELTLALEMFPRRVQPALDAWVRGELTEAQFLERSDWDRVWRFDPALYMDVFRFARDHNIPMQAVNVDATLTREVGRVGFDAVPVTSREGVSKPAEPAPAYSDWLGNIHSMHLVGSRAERDSDEQRRYFIEAQLTWDRAMAEGIRDALAQSPDRVVVALIGSGHLRYGHGVPHQLRDLGIQKQSTLLPWDEEGDCTELTEGLADAVYRIAPGPATDV